MLRQRALTHTGEGGLTIFGMALRFDLNPPRELANTFLTALARSAQCTGFYAWILDALSRARALTISRACCTVAGAHAHLGPAHFSYTQNLKSVAYLFSPRQHARCIARTRPRTLVCFERATTEVENTTAPPTSSRFASRRRWLLSLHPARSSSSSSRPRRSSCSWMHHWTTLASMRTVSTSPHQRAANAAAWC
jgi:hypothetical protein